MLCSLQGFIMPVPTIQFLLTALLLYTHAIASPASVNKPNRGQDDTNSSSGSQEGSSNPRAGYFKQIVGSSHYSNHSKSRTPEGVPLKVGIIGAGAAGLYAAILLDSLGIDYDIYEGADRIGGRIYTHHFDQEAWDKSTPDDPAYYDYYDVGAMRFPPMPYMDRVIGTHNWSLIPYINERVSRRHQVVQVPYIFSTNNTFQRYNDILTLSQEGSSANLFNVTFSQDGVTDKTFDAADPNQIWEDETSLLADALSADFTSGFDELIKLDSLSIRSFLLAQGFDNAQIDWIETMTESTNHFDMYSMTEAVLDQWIFNSAGADGWTCINGGMDMLTKGMNLIIKNKPVLNSRVTDIRTGDSDGTFKLIVNSTEHTYAHIISTVPLGALQVINTTELHLDFNQKNAIRKLQYDPSTKIGFKFKSRWWETLPSGPFQGGQSFTDLPIRRSVYPSYGINITDAPGSMIASYVWGQDSLRLSSYLNEHNVDSESPPQPTSIELLVNITLSDMALLHNVSFEFLAAQLEDYHAYEWYQSEYSVGAFALFGPGQFSSILPYLMTPAADGHVHWGGEALSSGHAWIIGAVNSAWRNVVEILDTEGLSDLKEEFYQMWGDIDEVDRGWYDYDPSVSL